MLLMTEGKLSQILEVGVMRRYCLSEFEGTQMLINILGSKVSCCDYRAVCCAEKGDKTIAKVFPTKVGRK
jgi:hypothetical protein